MKSFHQTCSTGESEAVKTKAGEDYAPVVLGGPGDEALLGVVTLEILGLMFHPFSRTLHPIRAMLA